MKFGDTGKRQERLERFIKKFGSKSDLTSLIGGIDDIQRLNEMLLSHKDSDYSLEEMGSIELNSYISSLKDLRDKHNEVKKAEKSKYAEEINSGDNSDEMDDEYYSFLANCKGFEKDLEVLILEYENALNYRNFLISQNREDYESKENLRNMFANRKNEYTNKLEEKTKQLNETQDPEIKNILEDYVNSLKNQIQQCDDEINKIDSELTALDERLAILTKGGIIPESTTVNDDKSESVSKDEVSTPEEKDEEPLEMKDRLSENEDAKIDGEGVVAETEPKVMTPDIEDTPNPPEADPTRQDAVVDPNGADMSTESESEEKSKDGEAVVPLPEPVKGGEEPQKVTNVHQPKPGLWSKVKETLAKVGPWLLVLLGGIGIGVGVTNVINNNVETTEESDEETNDESATRGSYPGFVGSVEAPATEEAPAAADDKAIEIKTGEAVYDTATGIEVTRDGSAYSHEGNTTTQVESRDLEQTNNNTAIVTQQDLQQPNEFAVTSLERTGEEVPEEVARATMTEQEQANLDTAVDDALSNAFNSAFAGGYNPYFSSNEPKL